MGPAFTEIAKQLIHGPVWKKDHTLRCLWIFLLVEADHPDRQEYKGQIHVPYGSVLASEKQLADSLQYESGRGMNHPERSHLESLLKRLQDMDMITCQGTGRGFLITLCNWGKWHTDEHLEKGFGKESVNGWECVPKDGPGKVCSSLDSLSLSDSKDVPPSTSDASTDHQPGHDDPGDGVEVPEEARTLARDIEQVVGVMLHTQSHHVGLLHREYRSRMSDEWILDIITEAKGWIRKNAPKWNGVFGCLKNQSAPQDEEGVPLPAVEHKPRKDPDQWWPDGAENVEAYR